MEFSSFFCVIKSFFFNLIKTFCLTSLHHYLSFNHVHTPTVSFIFQGTCPNEIPFVLAEILKLAGRGFLYGNFIVHTNICLTVLCGGRLQMYKNQLHDDKTLRFITCRSYFIGIPLHCLHLLLIDLVHVDYHLYT